MSHDVPLRSLTVSGLTSLSDERLELSSPVTLLVGPNGSGKSNVVDAFELLGRVVDRQLNDHLVQRGGVSAVMHRPSDPALTPDAIVLEVWGDWHDDLSNGYRVHIGKASGDTAYVVESALFHDRERYPGKPHATHLGTASESQLRSVAERDWKAKYVLDVVSGCRVFHFDDTSPDAPPKRVTAEEDNVSLAPDARNLAAVLRRLRDQDEARYQRITRAIRTVAPYFDDFVLKSEQRGLRLRWRERRLDGVFGADALSDGTLRFICLSVLLLQDTTPRTIVLDEPELGLHPFAIHQLAALMRSSAVDGRVIAATQSVTLLEQFSVDEVAIVERTTSGTQIHRPDPTALEVWLHDYSLGDLWQKNLLGGRPRPDDSPKAVG